jgi:hypothetical protein
MMKSQGVVLFVGMMLLAASVACMKQSAAVLNEGKGTRDDPVAARQYAKTDVYDVRVLSAVRPAQLPTPAGQETEQEYMKVQFGVKCTKAEDEVCNLGELRSDFKVVSKDGILYDPALTVEAPNGDNVLAGEILGGAEQTGWLIYQVPVGVTITEAVVGYGEDMRVFLRLP